MVSLILFFRQVGQPRYTKQRFDTATSTTTRPTGCGTSGALLFVCICNPPCDSLRHSWRETRQSRLHTSIAVEFLLQPILTWVCRRNSSCDLGTAVSWWERIGRRSRYSRAAAPGPGSLETSGHLLMAVRARSVVGHWEEC